MADFDLSDGARESSLGDRIAWLERELKRALSQRRVMFVQGVLSVLEMLEDGATAADVREFYEELT